MLLGSIVLVTLSCSKDGLEKVDDVCTKMNDIKFMEYCYNNFDVNKDGKVSMTEAAAVKTIDTKGCDQIASLDGIEYFTGLTELICNGNQLTSLNVSNQPELKVLDCNYNQITQLDVSKNTALTKLDCGMNAIPSLDISKNTALKSLRCDANKIESLDISKNTLLTDLNCASNLLTTLTLSGHPDIYGIMCYHNQITSLDLSETAWKGYTRYDIEYLQQKGEMTLYLTEEQIQRICDGFNGIMYSDDRETILNYIKQNYQIDIQKK